MAGGKTVHAAGVRGTVGASGQGFRLRRRVRRAWAEIWSRSTLRVIAQR
ncbi:hypothetical protein [Rhodococcus sp. 66b]|nr:hypothetical protein [Rhodococcus sp. 66b]